MDTVNSLLPAEDTMQRAFEPHPLRRALHRRFAAPLGSEPGLRLPPTRAARPARSRGVFFGGTWRARLSQWARNAACIAVAALAIAASAHFGQPALNAAANNGNAGPELLAAATQIPAFLTARAR
jgi:negative regulator of sigma E activity